MNKMKQANRELNKAFAVFDKTLIPSAEDKVFCGVDLGTASIILTAINQNEEALACEMELCQVAKDGLVVDYAGAVEIVRRLKRKLEKRLNIDLIRSAIAVPPGTGNADSSTHRYIAEAAELEVIKTLDEPTAANLVLGVENGVIVDIGGGTTGLSIFKDGQGIYTADEATGGTHISLVLMGRHKITFEEAEKLKKSSSKSADVLTTVRPVLEKMASIVKNHIAGHEIREAWLVGGTCSLKGIEEIFEKVLQIPVYKPSNPMLVTPLGIAKSCLLT